MVAQKVSISLTGKIRSKQSIEKQRASIMGKNKGRVFGLEFREMRRRIMLGTHHTEAQKKKMSQVMKQKIANGEFFPCIPSHPYPQPNKIESKLLRILKSSFPDEYKYTGDGSVIISHLIPDFTNCNGRKEVIELFGDYWHKGENPQNKIDKYATFGFHCLVIWEHELVSKTEVVDKIKRFREATIKS
jgi:hypothetical protein